MSPPAPPPHRRLAWTVILFLFAGSVLNYVDRSVLAVVKPQLQSDLGLSNTDYSLAVNAFLLVYAVFYVWGGRLADRFGCRRTFTANTLFWSAATALHAFTGGLASLCVFRGLLGIGEGGFYPSAMRGAAEWFCPEDRAKAVGLFLSGLSVGALLAPPMVAGVVYFYGWRAAFLVTGALGFVLVPMWLLLHARIRRIFGEPDPAPAWRAARVSDPDDPDLPLSWILRSRKYWFLCVARGLTDASWYFYLFWIPGYFQEVRGFNLTMVGLWLWLPYFCAGIGALSGAWLSSGLIRRGLGLSRSRKLVLLGSALCGIIGAGSCFVPSATVALALVCLALFAQQSWGANIHTAISDVAPPRHVAVLYGLTGAFGTFMGVLAQFGIGRLVDAVGYGPVFAGSALAFATSAILVLAAGKIERIRRSVKNHKPLHHNPAAEARI